MVSPTLTVRNIFGVREVFFKNQINTFNREGVQPVCLCLSVGTYMFATYLRTTRPKFTKFLWT